MTQPSAHREDAVAAAGCAGTLSAADVGGMLAGGQHAQAEHNELGTVVPTIPHQGFRHVISQASCRTC
eukprot:1140879-Pelagomonas_calceolata.AAC.4